MAAPLPAFLSSPSFWIGVLRSADKAVQEAAPDYTIGHHAAAVLGRILGVDPVSVPTSKAAEPVLQALGEAASEVAMAAMAASTPAPAP